MKIKEIGPRCGRALLAAPFDPPMGCYLRHTLTELPFVYSDSGGGWGLGGCKGPLGPNFFHFHVSFSSKTLSNDID